MTSRVHIRTALLAGPALLALAGCNAPTGTANDQIANEASVNSDVSNAALPPENLPLPAGDSAVVEDGDTAPPIQVASVPASAPAIPAADAVPLAEAVAAERLIAAGRGIRRIQRADGWAWMQDGQIIRTASADGRRVSYFRRGAATPYLVQQDKRSYGYADGRIAGEYDDHGRPQTPDARHRDEAQRFADEARQQHDRAQRASSSAKPIDRSHDRGGDGHHAGGQVTPRPSPTSTAGQGGRDGPGARPGADRHAGDDGRGSDRHGSADVGPRDHGERRNRNAGDDSQSNEASPHR